MPGESRSSVRIAADIGGTFTDIVGIAPDGALYSTKLSSTPGDYAKAVVDGIAELLLAMHADPEEVVGVVHGTTVATNAILEGKGARTALVTTKGFRDVLEMRRLRLPELYNLQYQLPPQLVPRRSRFEIDERMGPSGEVWTPLVLDGSVDRIAEQLRAQRIESLAICLLHSYANDAHEAGLTARFRELLGDDVFISTSSVVLPAIREYDRTSTTVVNSYLGPTVKRYVGSLLHRLKDAGITAPLRIMQSNGGVMSARGVIERPAYILESGPAAGVIAAAKLGVKAGARHLISLDMGGTTAKTAMIEDGQPAYTNEYEVGAGINTSSRLVQGGGYLVRLPFVEVSEIGAGGGSIVHVDSYGLVKVGPQSAGANPGPACYGLGGADATLTDALVTLGYINPGGLLSGDMPIDVELARKVIADQVANRTGLSVLDAAHGVFIVAVVNMTRAVKAVTTYRGRDPRMCALMAFGGNGPVHGAAIARSLGIEQVIVPQLPGVLSALGLILSDMRQEFVRTVFADLANITTADVVQHYRAIEDQALAELALDGIDSAQITISHRAEIKYRNQAHELSVPIDSDDLTVERLYAAFREEHRRLYGHASDDPAQLVSISISAIVAGPGETAIRHRADERAKDSGHAGSDVRPAYFGPDIGSVETPVVRREAFVGSMAGPVIIEDYDSTVVVPPGFDATVDESGNILLHNREAGPS